jgi:hypothetical protein
MWTVRWARALVVASVGGAALLVAGCGETGGRVEAVETLARPEAASPVVVEAPAGEPAGGGEPTRRGDGNVESILEFGLFGPALPPAEGVVYETDCRFEDDPYETCL